MGSSSNSFTSHTCAPRHPNKDPSPGVSAPLPGPSPPALLTCASSAGGRCLIGARWGGCHVLPHPAGGRASPHCPTSLRAGGCAPCREPRMLGGARGCFPRSAGSRTGQPGRREKRSAVAFHCPRRSSPPGRIAHLRPAPRNTGPAAWLFIGSDVGPVAFASRDPAPRLQRP